MEIRRRSFFYGWVVVGTLFAINVVAMGMGTANFGLFLKPMGQSLGSSRTLFGWLQTIRMISGATVGPVIGKIVDRFGPRVLIAIAGLMTGLCVVGLGLADSSWQLLTLFAIMGIFSVTGTGSLLTSVPAAKWFIRYRGRAIALTSLGIPVGAVFFVPFSQMLIDDFGWRNTWIGLGIFGSCAVVPLSLLFLRREPEDMGLLPDGDKSPDGGSSSAQTNGNSPGEYSWSLHDALRTTTLWRLVVVFGCSTLGMGSYGLHRIAFFIDRGFDSQLVAYASSMEAAIAGVTVFFIGLVLERVAPRVIGALAFWGVAVGITIGIFSYTPRDLLISHTIWGISAGILIVLQNYIWAYYFGRNALGAIRGFIMPATLFFGGIGPPLAGFVKETTGSYVLMWWGIVGGLVLAGFLLLSLVPAERRTDGS